MENPPPQKSPRETFVYLPITNPIRKQLVNYLNYGHFPKGCEEVVIPRDIVIGPFNYFEPNGYLKTLIEHLWEKRTRGGSFQYLSSNRLAT